MKEIYSMNNTVKIGLLLLVAFFWACTSNNQKEREVAVYQYQK